MNCGFALASCRWRSKLLLMCGISVPPQTGDMWSVPGTPESPVGILHCFVVPLRTFYFVVRLPSVHAVDAKSMQTALLCGEIAVKGAGV